MMRAPTPLTEKSVGRGLRYLSRCDPDLARIVRDFGPPPFWTRAPGFPTLIHIILEQQVSLASARAVYDRLLAAVSPLTPAHFLERDDTTLKAIGFSRQKANYGRYLAQAILAGRLDLAALGRMDDATAHAKLISVKGIGPWTADIYLLMALRRPDIWPSGDLALAASIQRLKGLIWRPKPAELEEFSAIWRPWRAIAAGVLWHFYLSDHGNEGIA